MILVQILFIGFFLFNLFLIYKNGGFKNNFAFSFVLGTYALFCFLSPITFYYQERFEIHGNFVGDYYQSGLHIYLLALVSLSAGYFFMRQKKTIRDEQEYEYSHRSVSFLFYFVFGMNIINLALSGISIFSLFDLGSTTAISLYRTQIGFSNYLSAFSDSLIAVLIIAYIFKIPRTQFLVWLLLSFFLFLLLGFRYRILLTLIGIFFIFYFRNKLSPSVLIKFTALSLVCIYLMIFVSENRRSIFFRKFDQVSLPFIGYNDFKFYKDENPILFETQNFLTDLSVIKYYNTSDVSYDYGATIFLYPFVRALPASFFENNEKPYPPPNLKTIRESYGTMTGFYSGSAVTNILEFYMSFGIYGALGFMFLFGLLIGRMENRVNYKDPLSLTFYVIVTISFFQYISRGYFPQYVNNLAYILIPYFLLYFLAKKSVKN